MQGGYIYDISHLLERELTFEGRRYDDIIRLRLSRNTITISLKAIFESHDLVIILLHGTFGYISTSLHALHTLSAG